jgi:hypothetical protein
MMQIVKQEPSQWWNTQRMIQDAIVKAISQMGDNIYQSFKVTKIEPTKGEYRDQEYVIVNFKYALLTGAVASVTSVGNAVEVLWNFTCKKRSKHNASYNYANRIKDVIRTVAILQYLLISWNSEAKRQLARNRLCSPMNSPCSLPMAAK